MPATAVPCDTRTVGEPLLPVVQNLAPFGSRLCRQLEAPGSAVGVAKKPIADSENERVVQIVVDLIGSEVQARLKALGPDARVAVLPQGPLTIPYLA